MRVFPSFTKDQLLVRLNVLVLFVCMFYEVMNDRHDFIVPEKYVMRTMNVLNYDAPQNLGLNKNLNVILGITELDFHYSSASLSFRFINVGPQRKDNNGNDVQNMHFDLIILNQTVFYKIAVDVALIQDDAIPEIYIYEDTDGNNTLDCVVLNQGIGYRSQNYSFLVKDTNKPEFLTEVRQIYAALYYRGFNLFNPNGSYFYLNWEFYYNHTHYTIVFHTQDQNLISFIEFDLILVDLNNAYQVLDYTRYFFVNMVNCSNHSVETCPGKVEYSFLYYEPGFKSYLLGLTKLNFTKHQQTRWFIDTLDIADMTPAYLETKSLKWANMTVFIVADLSCDPSSQSYDPQTLTCIPLCEDPLLPDRTYIYDGSSPGASAAKICQKCHYTCLTCTAAAKDKCQIACDPLMNRQIFPVLAAGDPIPANFECQCITTMGYVDVGTPYCPHCSQYIPGCIECDDIYECKTCNINMVLNADKTNCTCTMVQTTSRYGQCYGIIGCLVYFNDPVRNTVCIECNITENFLLVNYSCQCIAGYSLQTISGKWVCTPLPYVCGDGIKTINQQCDDFNIFNGDGCNGTCRVQVGFICFGNLRETSFCIENVSRLDYIGAMKVEEEQSADLFFELWPYNGRLQDVGLLTRYLQTSIANFSSMGNLQIFTEHSFPNDKLRIRLRFDYTQNVNPLVNHYLGLKVYDREKEYQLKTNFNIVGANLQLTLVESDGHVAGLNYVMMVFAILAFIAMFVSFFSHNWVSIELLHTFQFCFFYYFLLNNINENQYKFLNFLQLSNGVNMIPDQISIYEYMDFNRQIYLMHMSKQTVENFNFTALVFCIPILLGIAMLAREIPHYLRKARRSNYDETSTYRQKSPKLDYVLSIEFIVGKVFLTLSLVFMNIIIFCFFIEQTHYYQQGEIINGEFQQFYLFALLTSVMVAYGMLVAAAANPYKFQGQYRDNQQPGLQFIKLKRFPPLYPLIYTSVVGIKIIFVALFLNDYYAQYILLSIEVVYLAGYLKFRPYKRVRNYEIKFCYSLHNIHNVWNSIGLIALIIVIIVANANNQHNKDQTDVAMKFVILVIMIVGLILAYLRLFVSKRIARAISNWDKQNQLQRPSYDINDPANYTDRPMRKNTISSIRKPSISQSRVQEDRMTNRPRRGTSNSFRSVSPRKNRIP